MSGSTVRETLGFISVVAGLVFVGVEIHQNTAIARAATRQALSASSSEFVLVAATNDELGRQIDKWLFGEEGVPVTLTSFAIESLQFFLCRDSPARKS